MGVLRQAASKVTTKSAGTIAMACWLNILIKFVIVRVSAPCAVLSNFNCVKTIHVLYCKSCHLICFLILICTPEQRHKLHRLKSMAVKLGFTVPLHHVQSLHTVIRLHGSNQATTDSQLI